mmetsp:Transcript_1591/g.3404  ORF Transcript_1591/g.3404 Transcript_1591/m.3404 type:complete len:204 (-) Transcript_1591:904-1515(-)
MLRSGFLHRVWLRMIKGRAQEIVDVNVDVNTQPDGFVRRDAALGRFARDPIDNRGVRFLHHAFLELLRQVDQCRLGLGYHQQTAGRLVQSMGTHRSEIDLGGSPLWGFEDKGKGIANGHDSVVFVAPRVANDPGGFVHNRKMRVFVHDGEFEWRFGSIESRVEAAPHSTLDTNDISGIHTINDTTFATCVLIEFLLSRVTIDT